VRAKFYDLAGAQGRRFSPYCWRARMALAHKGLDVDAIPVCFSDIRTIEGGRHSTVPVLVDGDRVVADSFDIALYLDEAYPDRPSLFKGEGGQAMARFIEGWANLVLNLQISRMIVKDVHDILEERDKPYFRETREKRFGTVLEAVQEDREARRELLRDSLAPLRRTLHMQPFIGGEGPLFADYIVFGTLQWARVTSTFAILADDDPVKDWFTRCLALHDGIGAMQAAA
jgi:glutathione S-transferase